MRQSIWIIRAVLAGSMLVVPLRADVVAGEGGRPAFTEREAAGGPMRDMRSGASGLGAITPVSRAAASPLPTTIERQTGTWIEGPGYDVTYGRDYDACAQRCLDSAKCLMIEYYRPERKCNLYDRIRPQKPGGASNVGFRREQASSGATGEQVRR